MRREHPWEFRKAARESVEKPVIFLLLYAHNLYLLFLSRNMMSLGSASMMRKRKLTPLYEAPTIQDLANFGGAEIEAQYDRSHALILGPIMMTLLQVVDWEGIKNLRLVSIDISATIDSIIKSFVVKMPHSAPNGPSHGYNLNFPSMRKSFLRKVTFVIDLDDMSMVRALDDIPEDTFRLFREIIVTYHANRDITSQTVNRNLAKVRYTLEATINSHCDQNALELLRGLLLYSSGSRVTCSDTNCSTYDILEEFLYKIDSFKITCKAVRVDLLDQFIKWGETERFDGTRLRFGILSFSQFHQTSRVLDMLPYINSIDQEVRLAADNILNLQALIRVPNIKSILLHTAQIDINILGGGHSGLSQHLKQLKLIVTPESIKKLHRLTPETQERLMSCSKLRIKFDGYFKDFPDVTLDFLADFPNLGFLKFRFATEMNGLNVLINEEVPVGDKFVIKKYCKDYIQFLKPVTFVNKRGERFSVLSTSDGFLKSGQSSALGRPIRDKSDESWIFSYHRNYSARLRSSV